VKTIILAGIAAGVTGLIVWARAKQPPPCVSRGGCHPWRPRQIFKGGARGRGSLAQAT